MTVRPGMSARHVGRGAGDIPADRRTRELLRVTADGAHDEREAAALGIEYPREAVVLRAVLDARGHAGLYVLDLYRPDRTQRAIAHERARIASHRIRGIAVRDREHATVLARARDEIAGLGKSFRDRLVADDVEARIECGGGVGIVRIVRRHDRHRVDAVGARLFLRQHRLHVAVAARRVEAHARAGRARTRRIAGEHARDRAPPAVQLRGTAMRPADPRIGAATDDSKTQWSPETFA